MTHVIITHAHGDHVGGLVRDGRAVFPSAAVLFFEKELAAWSDAGAAKTASESMHRMFGSVAGIVSVYGDRVRTFFPERIFFRCVQTFMPWMRPGIRPDMWAS